MPKHATSRPYPSWSKSVHVQQQKRLFEGAPDRNHNQLGTTFVRLEFTVGAGYGGEYVGSESVGASEHFNVLLLLYDVEGITTGEDVVVSRQL